MPLDLSFIGNSGLAWLLCGTSGIQEGPVAAAKCPLCAKLFTDPLFMDAVKEQYVTHMKNAHEVTL